VEYKLYRLVSKYIGIFSVSRHGKPAYLFHPGFGRLKRKIIANISKTKNFSKHVLL